MHVRYNDGYDSPHYDDRLNQRDDTAGNILLIVLAILIPPLAVWLIHGFRGHFWLNLFLAIFLFYLPAQVHAVWLIARRS